MIFIYILFNNCIVKKVAIFAYTIVKKVAIFHQTIVKFVANSIEMTIFI